MPTPEKSLRSVDCPQDGQSVSVGSVNFCCTSCVVSQFEQAYSYVGTGPPSVISRRGLALAIAEC
jgi:hypothetical protein